MNGNACRDLLNHLDELEILLPQDLIVFVTALRAFKKVKDNCFGQTIQNKAILQEQIMDFRVAYLDLGIEISTKVHILVDHVYDFCIQKDKGLGYFSEQASEAVHSDFSKTWTHYLVSDIKNPNYLSQLYKAVLKYNGKHV